MSGRDPRDLKNRKTTIGAFGAYLWSLDMADFKKLKLKSFPEVQSRETSEAKYWKSFATTLGTYNERMFGTCRPTLIKHTH